MRSLANTFNSLQAAAPATLSRPTNLLYSSGKQPISISPAFFMHAICASFPLVLAGLRAHGWGWDACKDSRNGERLDFYKELTRICWV
ncbi:hypothetical protein L6164_001335 [Bauhinia variegata]|uniref:Uncharacterized protein n=1 Tax=Bauhinia variegata TaxID=167791 RepID=A0ACB9Q9A4_BAUVA|nr:hypothetical protein L6164_001335 [Bauhinia variegata]